MILYDPSRPFQEQLGVREGRTWEKLLVGNFRVSLQASDIHYSEPRSLHSDPFVYSRWEAAVFDDTGEWVLVGEDGQFRDLKAVQYWERGSCPVGGYIPTDVINELLARCLELSVSEETTGSSA